MTIEEKPGIIRKNGQEMRRGCINTQVISAGKNLKRYEKNWKEPGRRRTQENMICTMCFVAVLYVVQGGIQWRMLPSDYPKWQTVYYHFRVWGEKDETGVSILEKVLQKLVKQIRNEDLRRDKTTFGIIDAQSVQNADTAEEKGYDAGKKYQGSNVTSL